MLNNIDTVTDLIERGLEEYENFFDKRPEYLIIDLINLSRLRDETGMDSDEDFIEYQNIPIAVLANPDEEVILFV